MDKISFWELLEKYEVVIPIIQRDYAQGRIGKEHIREKFLTQIKNALDDSNQSGELDFVYGTVKDGCFYPLDGQQRLTTLWLLHWFIASKAGKLNEAKDTLKKFSYETRTSSREFCKKLCDFDISNVVKVADAIQKQTWFYVAWKQDPTIQSMLRMLEGTDRKNKRGNDFIDGIEEASQCYDHDHLECRLPRCRYIDYWNQLAGSACSVKFSKLEINSAELPVSDDLYIKMNARGKPLSDFENFKADLISSLSKEDAVTYGSLIDNNWTNHFWSKEQIDIFDAKWMAFLCRFSVCMRIEASNDKNEKIAAILKDWRVYKDDTDKSFSYEYKDFRDFQNIFDGNVLKRLQNIFAGWEKLSSLIKFSLASAWNDNFDFIPVRKEKSVSTLTMKTRVLFYGTMLFCEKYHNEYYDKDQNKWRECKILTNMWESWKRVIWNLAENTNESSDLNSFVGVMKMIGKLAEGCLDIYAYLENNADVLMNNFKFDQLKEEIDKAKQINSLSSPDKETIIRAEQYAFFNGAIRFLYRNENGEEKWDGFAKKLENAQSYFENDGLKESEYPNRNKILISYCSRWDEQLKRRYLFGKKAENWRSILLDQNLCNPVHHLLSDNKSNQSIQIDNCEWLKNVITIIVNNDDKIWDEIDPKAIDSYQLEWQWNVPCLWLSRYPAATIRLCDTEKDKFQDIVRQADSMNSILSEKYFRNKDYEFSINNKKYIWHPWSGKVSFNDRQMSIADFETHLGGGLNGNFQNS